jgi:hypothetical protein
VQVKLALPTLPLVEANVGFVVWPELKVLIGAEQLTPLTDHVAVPAGQDGSAHVAPAAAPPRIPSVQVKLALPTLPLIELTGVVSPEFVTAIDP